MALYRCLLRTLCSRTWSNSVVVCSGLRVHNPPSASLLAYTPVAVNVRHCISMSSVRHHGPELKNICRALSKHIEKPEPYIVRVSELPWSATEEEVVELLKPCSVKAVHLAVLGDGKPAGMAMVVLSEQEDVDKALQMDRAHIGRNRCMEVIVAQPYQLLFVIQHKKRIHDINNESHADRCVVRVRGLPYSDCNDEDIAEFFSGLQIQNDGILILLNYQGRPRGEAFVKFTTPEIALKATKKNRSTLGSRYIEVYQSNIKSFDHNKDAYKVGTQEYNDRDLEHFEHRTDSKSHHMKKRKEQVSNVLDEMSVLMKGLPYETDEAAIQEFFAPLVPSNIDIHVYKSGRNLGLKNGVAHVDFDTVDKVRKAMKKNGDYLGPRYIELFCRKELLQVEETDEELVDHSSMNAIKSPASQTALPTSENDIIMFAEQLSKSYDRDHKPANRKRNK